MRIFLTGASGFVGQALRQALELNSKYSLRCVYRATDATSDRDSYLQGILVGSIADEIDWRVHMKDVAVVVHIAALAHVQADNDSTIALMERVNTAATLTLARHAAESGVRRFVFLSTVKVHGEQTLPVSPFNPCSQFAPTDSYAVSKMKAEQGLLEISRETGMEIVIIRPVLVYGPGVKANFRSMMSWLNRGIPLPLGAIDNKRSLVALDNLVDLIMTCIDHPAAANQTFMVSDGEDLSTTELLLRVGRALNKPARLLPVPRVLLKASAALLGKRDMAQRLCGSLQVDITKTRQLLGWTPLVSVDSALRKTAMDFQAGLQPDQ